MDGRIIFVTPESVKNSLFQAYLNSLQAENLLDRFVFDECHVVFDSKEEFRPALADLGNLVLRQVQMVYDST
jgi:superfamily II DNA helicase RecQ